MLLDRPSNVEAWNVSTPVPLMPSVSPTVCDTARRMLDEELYTRAPSSSLVASVTPLRSSMSPAITFLRAVTRRVLLALLVQRLPFSMTV